MTRPPFELRILGPTELHGPEPEVADAFVRQPKRLAILAYLALVSVGGFRRRDQVIAMFWPDLDQAAGRTNLRKALHGIRESLGVDFVVTRGEDELRVDRAQLACDAVALQERVAEGRWSDALALYRGELLEGLFPEGVAQEFHDWLSAQRRALREQAARAAWECATLEESRGDRTAAAVMARRARELDPDNEEGVRRLMELLDRRGDRGSALRVYAEWQSRMLEEFGVEPAPETRKAARRIQASRKGESHETPALAPNDLPPTESAKVPTSGRDANTAPTPRAPGRRGSWIAGLALGSFATILLLGWWTQRPASSALSVTVAELRPIGDPLAVAYAMEIGEILATELAADTTMVVRIAPSGTRGPGASTSSGTTYVTDGAVHVKDGRARVTLRLLRAADGVSVWADTYWIPEGSRGTDSITTQAVVAMRSRLARTP